MTRQKPASGALKGDLFGEGCPEPVNETISRATVPERPVSMGIGSAPPRIGTKIKRTIASRLLFIDPSP